MSTAQSIHSGVQPFQRCNSCCNGMMMLFPDDIVECDSCGHRLSLLVDGTEYIAERMEGEERWLTI